jgi:hypothetical protein
MAALPTLYAQAPALAAASERVLSTDEMTGIQALERKHPTRLMEPGQEERREFEYIRRGTVTLGRTSQCGEGWHSNEKTVRFWIPSPRVPKETDARCYAYTTPYTTMILLCNVY